MYAKLREVRGYLASLLRALDLHNVRVAVCVYAAATAAADGVLLLVPYSRVSWDRRATCIFDGRICACG